MANNLTAFLFQPLLHVLLGISFFALLLLGWLSYRGRRLHERKALDQAAYTWQQVWQHAPCALAIGDRNGTLIQANTLFTHWLQYREQDLIGRNFREITHADDIHHESQLLKELIRGQRERYRMEKRFLRKDGSYLWVDIVITPCAYEDAVPHRFVALMHDISQYKHQQDQLQLLQERDPVTLLANQRQFEQSLYEYWQHHAFLGQPISLILMDLDAFKGYNDFYGMPAGDRCLQEVAYLLEQQMRAFPIQSALLARLGGAEFAFLLPAHALEQALAYAQTLRQALLELGLPHENRPDVPWVTASFGVACVSAQTQYGVSDLLRQARLALYQAKADGRNRVASASLHWQHRLAHKSSGLQHLGTQTVIQEVRIAPAHQDRQAKA